MLSFQTCFAFGIYYLGQFWSKCPHSCFIAEALQLFDNLGATLCIALNLLNFGRQIGKFIGHIRVNSSNKTKKKIFRRKKVRKTRQKIYKSNMNDNF